MRTKLLKRAGNIAFFIFSVMLTFIPESMFSHCCWIKKEFLAEYSLLNWLEADVCNIVITKIVVYIILFIFSVGVSYVYSYNKKVKIAGSNYSIVIEYGDLFKTNNCQRVINFDECYTTTTGTGPADIKEGSVCGQYLTLNQNLDIEDLIRRCGAKPCKRKSKYNNQTCYEPGTIVPNGDDLLMAFTRLESNGKSKKFTVKEYLKCLELLWQEIDNNYNQKDVYIPLLGTGVARFDNGASQSLSKQEAIDLIISSYKLSPYKLKDSNTLHIICTRSDDFSIDNLSV